jgi:hypothetical protein
VDVSPRFFISNTSALVVSGQMTTSSLHRYQFRARSFTLINSLSDSQLAKGFIFIFLVDGCEGPDCVLSCHGFGDSLKGRRDCQVTAVMDFYIKQWICWYTFHIAGKANEAGLLQGWVHWI